MTNTFRLDPDELDRLAGDLDQVQAREYRQALTGLHQINTALGSAWVGSSRDAFQTAYGGWVNTFERLGQDLPAMAVFLRATADEYRKLDRGRRAGLYKTGFDQPPGPTPSPGGGVAHKIGLPSVANFAEAQAMFEQMRLASWDGDPDADMPWGYTLDGCYARADKMSDLILQQYGFRPYKVWAFATDGTILDPGVPYFFGGPDGIKVRQVNGVLVPVVDASTLMQSVPATWGYHVAPVVRVPKPDGAQGYDWYVIDPSTARGPVLVSEWRDAMLATGARAVQIDTDLTPPGQAPRREGQERQNGTGYWPGFDPVLPDHADRTLDFYSWCEQEGELCAGVNPVTGEAARVSNVNEEGFSLDDPSTWEYEVVPESEYRQP